ncbi:hypothetical protein RJ641_021826 [Dillenia turbinata]|uniref:Uncharacterized protein n=1 Tax=Dillenia turbinata TaxID=194707 RepID=A0AAN8YW39_9MAGN
MKKSLAQSSLNSNKALNSSVLSFLVHVRSELGDTEQGTSSLSVMYKGQSTAQYVFMKNAHQPHTTSLIPTTKTIATINQHFGPLCLFGDKGSSKNDKESSPWKSFEKAMGNLRKEPSIEDVLRQQIEKQEYHDDEGSGGGSGRGGGGGGSDNGGTEDEGMAGILDELVQVIFATLGFVFLYIYIINGEEMLRLAKDYIKFLFGGRKSVRLRRAMYMWGRFLKSFNRKTQVPENWLEQAIINTNTWWDSPEKYRRMLQNHVAAQSYASQPNRRSESYSESYVSYPNEESESYDDY